MELTANDIKNFIWYSVNLFEYYVDKVNSINVFPVADQDTGTNLYNTLKRVWDRIKNLEINHVGKLLKEIAETALSEAQGNSGNILAMFLYGIYETLKDKEKITIKDLSEAFKVGYQYAKDAIANPKKGTILTVMKTLSKIFNTKKEENINKLLKKSIIVSIKKLKKYKNSVKELKEKDVLDAGGLGFIIILKGWLKALGDDIKVNLDKYFKKNIRKEKINKYCINILAEIRENVDNLVKEISKFESVVVKRIKDMIKLHVHHDDPKEIIYIIEKYNGKIIKIEYVEI